MRLFFVPLLMLAGDHGYFREVGYFHAQTEAELRADDGWLTVVGLTRLQEGENQAPAHLGKIVFSRGEAIYNGKVLKPDVDIVRSGKVSFFVIKRGDEFFIRVKDNDSALRRNFTGLKWFPVDDKWRIEARFTPFDQPKTILFDSHNGVKQSMESPGRASFIRDGKEYRLDAVMDGARLFFIFRDATSGKSTYGAARFLYADPAKGGVVILDFNKAINPPCAFTPYATCPLPPPQNRLTLAITAGEKKYSETIE